MDKNIVTKEQLAQMVKGAPSGVTPTQIVSSILNSGRTIEGFDASGFYKLNPSAMPGYGGGLKQDVQSIGQIPSKIGQDFAQRRQNLQQIDTSNISLGSKIFQNIGQIAGGVNDIVGETLAPVVNALPAIDPATNKLTTLGKALPNAISMIKQGASHVKQIQDVGNALNDFTTKHPEASGDLNALLNVIGAGLTVAGGAEIAGAGEKAAASDVSKEAEGEAVKIAEPVKTPGIVSKATLTPVNPTVKTSAKSLVDTFKGDTEQAKSFVKDLFTQEKSRVGNVAAESPTASLANKDLPQALETVRANLTESENEKNAILKQYGNVKTKDASTFVENIETEMQKRFGKLNQDLPDSFRNTADSFSSDLRTTLSKNTATAWDEFVDTWQDKLYKGSSQLYNSDLGAFIREYVTGANSDINKMVKDTVDEAEGEKPGEGSYSKAVDKYHQNAQARTDLTQNLGTRYTKTGEYGGAANFYAKAAGGDSSAKAALKNIEQVTGIPLSQRANLAKFAETFGTKASLARVITDIPATLIIRFGRLRLYNDLVSFLGDPEGALLQEIDKASNGTVSKVADGISKDSELTQQLKDSGMTPEQGAVLMLLGQVTPPKSVTSKRNKSVQ